ncbi:MAG: carboxypeptidase regulatory-like domain-containing protein, partial [Flavobacteriia bacterium]|nr:carboxypeptidase regulatory-like domain-containing protein [Flavobacteriia bacterium]
MKTNKLLFTLAFLVITGCFTSLHAQVMTISGIVNDSSGNVLLPKAVVSLIRLNDSTLVDFQRTGEKGTFYFDVELDTFMVLIEHPQFEPKTLYVFGNPAEKSVEIPFIRMGVKVKNLAEVVVQGNKNRVYYKGDTLVYVADSFKVAENAVVEDLLKKLPGIKIDENGQITSQGREISQVLVDGDEFFGSDPTIATKNLGAKGVESVQIYEKKAQDNASGMDEKIQVMDLKLKADAKRGYFGKASLATDAGLIGNPTTNFPFYESELLFNRFDKKQKFSVFFLSSNTPRSNFRFGDMNKFGLENERDQSGMSMWNQNGQRTNAGIPQTTKAGIYFNDRIKDWGKIGFNYSFNQNRLNATQSSLSQYFLQDTSYYTKDSIANISLNTSHKINLNFQAKLDSLTTLEIKPSMSFDEGITENTTINAFQTEAMVPTFTSVIDNTNNSKGYTARLESTIYRMFKKPR